MDRDELSPVTYPFNIRSTRPLERVLAIVLAAAAVTGISVDLFSPEPGRGVVPVAVAAIGLIVAWKWQWIGLPLLLLSPFVASIVDRSTVVTWTLVAIGALLLTLRGAHARYVAPFAALSAYVGEALVESEGFLASTALIALSVTFATSVSGSAIREHFRFLHSLQKRADEAVHTRTIEAGRRITEERLRIARDLHDVVGHEVAVVNMQIGMAEVALPPEAETSRASLHAAREGVRSILQESQRILTVLRLGPDEQFAPAPDLDRLGDLVASFRNLGLDIESRIELHQVSVEGAISTTAYRVVQEALTNAHRHGRGQADLAVLGDARKLTVTVSNPVAARPSGEGAGFGLVGMKERVQSMNGTVTMGRSGDRFVVDAILPLDGKKARA